MGTYTAPAATITEGAATRQARRADRAVFARP
jgi:hypothetical protein